MATEKQTDYINSLKQAEVKSAYGFPQVQQILKSWKEKNGIDWDAYDEIEDKFSKLNAPEKERILSDYRVFVSNLEIPADTAEASDLIDGLKSGKMYANFAATIDPRNY